MAIPCRRERSPAWAPCARVTGPITGARFVDGGKKLLVRIQDPPKGFHNNDLNGTFRLLDAENGQALGWMGIEFNQILGHWGSSGSVSEGMSFSNWCLSPDGKMIANTQSWAFGKLQARQLPGGKVLLDVKSENLDFTFVQFSPDGKQVAVVLMQNHLTKKDQPLVVIRMWDIQSGKEIRTFVPPPQPKESFQAHWFMFSPDGAYLAATGYEEGKAGVVRVWDVAGKNPPWLLEGETPKRDQARAIAFAPDSKTLAAVHDGKIRQWDPATGKRVKDVADYAGRCAALDFSPDGTRLIACAGEEAALPHQVRMWNLESGREIPLPLQAVGGYVFSENGQALVLADADSGNLLICDGLTGQLQHKVRTRQSSLARLEQSFYQARQGMGWPFALSPDGKTLVAGAGPGQLRRFEVATGKEIPAPGLTTDPTSALAFSPDGKKLLAAGVGRVLLHDASGKTPPLQLQTLAPLPVDGSKRPENPQPTCVALSSDGRRIAAGWDHGVVAVWDSVTGKLLWQADGHELGVRSLVFARDDQTLVSSGDRDGRVTRWNVATGLKQGGLALDGDKEVAWRRRVFLGPNALTVLSTHREGFQEWDLASGKVRRTIKDRGNPVAFSPDGRFMVASSPGSLHLIDLISGEERRSYAFVDNNTASSPPRCVRFSTDGRTVAGIAAKSVVRVWDRDTATLLATLDGHDGGVLALAFAPDGQSLATSAGDGTILLWRTPPRPVAAAKQHTMKTPAGPVGGKDVEGAALPAAARARLGLLRFQNGAEVSALRYTADGKSILVQTSTPDDIWMTWIDLALWDPATGKLQAQREVTRVYNGYTSGHDHVQHWAVSNDGKLLITSNTHPGKDSPNVYRPICVKEIDTGKILFEIKTTRAGAAYRDYRPTPRHSL
jgi:WD40 repeat protein